MSKRATLTEMMEHLSAATAGSIEPVERDWLTLCHRYHMAWSLYDAALRGVEPWEPEEVEG